MRLRVVKCGKLRTRTAFWGPGLRLRGIEEHEYKESIAIELGSALKCIEMFETRRALALKNKVTNRVVFFPIRFIRYRKTYIQMPLWLWEKKRSELEEAGFELEFVSQ